MALAALYVIWGSTYLAIRVTLEGFPPLLMAGSRFVLAGVLLYAVARLQGAHGPAPAQWRSGAVVGALPEYLRAAGRGRQPSPTVRG